MRIGESLRLWLLSIGLASIGTGADLGEKPRPTPGQADLTVVVSGVRSNRGKVHFALYDSKETFTKKAVCGGTSSIAENRAEWRVGELSAGEYAVAIYHDENEDGKFNMNFLGIPTEDYGFSNDARAGLGPPAWKKVVFQVEGGTNLHRIKIKGK